MSAYIGVVFVGVEIGLVISVSFSCNFCTSGLFIARPRTLVLGNIPNFRIYRNVEQYPNAKHVPGILILDIDAPVYFANASYLRERITRWVDEEESRIKATGKTSLQYVIMDMSGVGKIDTSGTSMLEEVQKITQRRELQLVLVNPGSEVMKKLNKSKFQNNLGERWLYLTVKKAVGACNFNLRQRTNLNNDESEGWNC
ncbi:sulfate transporter 3.1-like [Vigna umbellata]|uniref:sulfate transporter 3.1-like n=1 Tax=Vigna umbellata TaxID=87088 RepID=UPI001F5FD383|nr:sulfate transporter 3.1-like [Vigna umbellata]